MHRNVAIPDYRSLVTQTSGMNICQIGYDICEFDSLRGLGIDIIGRVHFDNRDRFAIWMGSIGKATEPCQQTSGCWHLTWQFLEPWHGRWCKYKIFIACTDNIYDLENEGWLLRDMIDHVGIYGSRVAEGVSAFNVGLVLFFLGGGYILQYFWVPRIKSFFGLCFFSVIFAASVLWLQVNSLQFFVIKWWIKFWLAT